MTIQDINKMNPYDHQAYIAKHYKLEWWYVTKANKCCGLYPRIDHNADGIVTWFYCENCGRKSERYSGFGITTPEIIELWNSEKTELTLFDFMEEES